MFVGVLRLSFHLPGARSLKEKRMIVRSFRDRVRARLDVSIAEVEHLDLHKRATFGVAVVSKDASMCDELLASVASMASTARDAVLLDRSTEILTVGDLTDRSLGALDTDDSSDASDAGEEDDDA